MTTEIAVSNHLGIALATDSAVTISSGGHIKVFDTADKLFELSALAPVAVMINGNMNCLETPWEILIKEFRAKEGNKTHKSIQEWADDFLNYIGSHDPGVEETVGGYLDRAIEAEISEVQSMVRRVVSRYITQTSRGADTLLTKGDLDIRRLLEVAIKLRSQEIDEHPIAESMKDITPDALMGSYRERIANHLDSAFAGQKLTPEEREPLVALVLASLIRSPNTNSATGIVIAGYGADDIFPSVFSCEVDGRVLEKLKVFKKELDHIATCRDGGMVTYFAQTDVIERLLKGADNRFVKRAGEFIESAVFDAVTKTFQTIQRRKLGRKATAERDALIAAMAEAARDEFRKNAADSIKKTFSQEFDSMIAMMPKQELIEFAEALVRITAIERKATVDEGTVGGPVDVALITKHEGFVWIKRKHHFPRELNPRYFWRRFGNANQGNTAP